MTILKSEAAADAAAAAPAAGEAQGTTAATETAAAVATDSAAATTAEKAPEQGTQPAGDGGAQAKADDAAPAPIEVKLPDGVQASPELIEAVKAAAKDGTSAQALVDKFFEVQKAADEQARASWEQQQKQWVDQIKADKDLGGAAYDANLKHAERAMQQFASPELRKILDSTGLGNHPEMVRMAVAVGKALAEDTIAGTTAAGTGAARSEEDRLKTMYPSMFKEK